MARRGDHHVGLRELNDTDICPECSELAEHCQCGEDNEVNNIHNPNCDGGHCESETGEVRVLPIGGDGNLILCRACFAHEMEYRRERNRELAAKKTGTSFDIVSWYSLKVYGDQ